MHISPLPSPTISYWQSDLNENQNQFQQALYDKNLEELERLLIEYPDEIDPTYDDHLAIRLASYHGNETLVTTLLRHPKCDPSAGHNQAIIGASQNGHDGVVRLLLNDSRVNPTDQWNKAYKVAQYSHHSTTVELLCYDERISHVLKINKQFTMGLFLKNFEKVENILTLHFNEIDTSSENNFAIKLASLYGKVSLVKILMKHPKTNPSCENNSPIILASENGYLEVVRELLKDRRVNPADFDNEAIKQARFNHHPRVALELLKDYRVSIPYLGRRVAALSFAFFLGNLFLKRSFPLLDTTVRWTIATTVSTLLYLLLSKVKNTLYKRRFLDHAPTYQK